MTKKALFIGGPWNMEEHRVPFPLPPEWSVCTPVQGPIDWSKPIDEIAQMEVKRWDYQRSEILGGKYDGATCYRLKEE